MPVSGYIVYVEGKPLDVDYLTIEQCRAALIEAIETIEIIDQSISPIENTIGRWRLGKTNRSDD